MKQLYVNDEMNDKEFFATWLEQYAMELSRSVAIDQVKTTLMIVLSTNLRMSEHCDWLVCMMPKPSQILATRLIHIDTIHDTDVSGIIDSTMSRLQDEVNQLKGVK